MQGGHAHTHTHTHTHIYIYIHTHTYTNKHTYTHTHTHTPECEHGDWGVSWNQETEFKANKPDIIIKHRKEGTCKMMYMTIPAGRNVTQKEAEKKLNTRFYV